MAELKKLEGRLGSAETERGNGVEREVEWAEVGRSEWKTESGFSMV